MNPTIEQQHNIAQQNAIDGGDLAGCFIMAILLLVALTPQWWHKQTRKRRTQRERQAIAQWQRRRLAA